MEDLDSRSNRSGEKDAASLVVREEMPEDIQQVRQINELAFDQPHEANVVDRLRTSCEKHISLVAEVNGTLVGHILFTPSVVKKEGHVIASGMGLAPMAVLPEYQNKKIGSALVNHGLEALKADGCPFVIVLGHPEYYPRFGFVSASRYGLRCQYEGVPDEVFMALELSGGALDGIDGVAYYRDEFDEAM